MKTVQQLASVLLCLSSLTFFSLFVNASEEKDNDDVSRTFDQLIKAVQSRVSSDRRIDAAQKLSDLVHTCRSELFSERHIAQLSALLQDENDSVRYWSATALGYLGPRARSAIPALEKALEERADDLTSKSSRSAIRLALQRIRTESHEDVTS
jgi:HEAT repeat protein